MAVDYFSIGSRIRYFRTQHNISQEAMAEKCQLSRSHYGYIERGEKAPSLESLIRIANVLEIPSDELLVDNLTCSTSKRSGDDYYVLMDCTPEEETILIKNMKGLKEILRRYKIK